MAHWKVLGGDHHRSIVSRLVQEDNQSEGVLHVAMVDRVVGNRHLDVLQDLLRILDGSCGLGREGNVDQSSHCVRMSCQCSLRSTIQYTVSHARHKQPSERLTVG